MPARPAFLAIILGTTSQLCIVLVNDGVSSAGDVESTLLRNMETTFLYQIDGFYLIVDNQMLGPNSDNRVQPVQEATIGGKDW